MSRIITDEEGAAFVFENEWDTAIPFSFTDTPEDGLVITVFPEVRPVAEEFLARFAARPTSAAAFSFLFAELSPYMSKWGYQDDRFRDRWGYILRCDTPPAPVENAGNLSTFVLKEVDEKRNRTTYDLRETCRAGCVGYGIAENGKIVSLAVTHDAPPDTGTVEVGVETIPAARHRGYASACLRALARDLCARGLTVEYRCGKHNAASRRTALAASFRQVGRYYYYIGRRVR